MVRKPNNKLELKFCDFNCVHADFSENTPPCYTETSIKCNLRQREVAKAHPCKDYKLKYK